MLDFRRLWRKSNRAPRFMVEPQHTLPKARMIQGIGRLPFSAKEGKMRFGESFGEACRFCGCTQIIVWPPSSAGHGAQCSKEALAWDARLDQLAARRLEHARAAFAAAEAEKRAAERVAVRAARRAARHAAVASAGTGFAKAVAARLRSVQSGEARLAAAAMQRTRRLLARALPARSRTADNF
jgi:hypothetical protein